MNAFVSVVRTLSQACGVLAALMLAAAIVVVCQMVVLRYFLNVSTIWQTEFVTYAIVASTFLGSPYVLMNKKHVNVDLLPLYLGRRARLVLALFAALAALLFCLVLAWTAWLHFHEAWSGGWRTDTVWAPPLWIPLLPLPLGISILALQYLVDILCLLQGHELPFGLAPEERP